jgi:NAD(P)-dependent dehydrogenase (short-subunit alcohol dehydrogenase family)
MKSRYFEGKVAIITGSSRGIGKGIAMALANKGATIVLNGRNADRLAVAEQEIRKIHDRVISVCCDVSTEEGGTYLIEEAYRNFQKIDILINNVGISMRGNFADLNPEVFRMMFESNVMGAVHPVLAGIKYLRDTRGSIIFISSIAGIRGLPGLSAYCSSKMSLRALAESLRIEEAKYHLHVGLIFVGYTENEKDKETVAANGSRRLIAQRSGKGVCTIDFVARAVVRSLWKKKFITVLSSMGKLTAFIQPLFPKLVEHLIIANISKFEERSK